MARCCVTEIQGGIQGPVEPSGAPRTRNQTRTVGNFLFAQTVISRRHAFLFIHQPTMPPPRRCDGVELLFLSRCQTFFSFRSRAVLLLFLELLLSCSLQSLIRPFLPFSTLFTRPILFRTLTYTAVVLALSHTPRALGHHPHKKPSIHQKGASKPQVTPPTPQPSKETPKHPKNPPETKPKCPPSAPW